MPSEHPIDDAPPPSEASTQLTPFNDTTTLVPNTRTDIYTDGSFVKASIRYGTSPTAGWGVHICHPAPEDHQLATDTHTQLYGPVSVTPADPLHLGATTLTNNTAELTAVAEAFLHILTSPLNTPSIRMCFGSKYASHTTRGLWAPKTNKELVKVVKVLYRKIRQIYTIQWHLIKGLSQVWGNEQADELANKGRTEHTNIGRASLHQRYDPFLFYLIKVRDTQPHVQSDPITQAIKEAARDAFPQIPPKAKKP